ncbi:unnamed protein product, partial [Sphagnum jensenii]
AVNRFVCSDIYVRLIEFANQIKKYEANEIILTKQNLCSVFVLYQNNEDVQCSICLNTQSDCVTSCDHHFHTKCIITWLCQSSTCPYCRTRL